ILTIEDPMEFNYKHKKSIVNQREVGMDTKSYDNALISAMREAPDLLMIGEIRDKPTLQSALLFAQTGHLCLSTLHANNSYHALNRIINFFPREARDALLADLAISLRCVVSQRLVRAKTGGRIPAVEIMLNTSHISDLIKKGEMGEIKEAMEQSLAPGSQTFEQALYNLYSDGQIELEHALASSDSPTNLHWLINNGVQTRAPEASRSSEQDSNSRTTTGPAADFSSIKLNLDMV
ncbi:MAG TPA: ATPase, T2SS/T4P/T4SS family, partial [Burkholderiales bacterium]|nr:ATPase, T2SS/T4P/T4SS family [Burkholderiales bacterium]